MNESFILSIIQVSTSRSKIIYLASIEKDYLDHFVSFFFNLFSLTNYFWGSSDLWVFFFLHVPSAMTSPSSELARTERCSTGDVWLCSLFSPLSCSWRRIASCALSSISNSLSPWHLKHSGRAFTSSCGSFHCLATHRIPPCKWDTLSVTFLALSSNFYFWCPPLPTSLLQLCSGTSVLSGSSHVIAKEVLVCP